MSNHKLMTHTHTKRMVVPSTTHKEWWYPSFSGSPVYTYMKEMIRRGASENSVMHSMLMTCCTCAPLSIVVPTGLGVHVICEQLLRHFFLLSQCLTRPAYNLLMDLIINNYIFLWFDYVWPILHEKPSKKKLVHVLWKYHLYAQVTGIKIFWPFAYYS